MQMSTVRSPRPEAIDSLRLVGQLCDLYERRLSGSEDNVPEMVRVIRAVSAGGSVVLAEESEVARVLREEMRECVLLWAHVLVESVGSPH